MQWHLHLMHKEHQVLINQNEICCTNVPDALVAKDSVSKHRVFFKSWEQQLPFVSVFDNIMYKSEVYLNDIDQPDKTLTGVRLYNEYQDSNSPTTVTPLILGRNSNLRRKFRDWNAILPRNQGSRERIRNPWVKLVLQFDNTSNYKLILHDIVVSYSI